MLTDWVMPNIFFREAIRLTFTLRSVELNLACETQTTQTRLNVSKGKTICLLTEYCGKKYFSLQN